MNSFVRLIDAETFRDCEAGLARLGFSPGAKIHGVEADTEHVCRNESELGGAEADDAHDGAIDGR